MDWTVLIPVILNWIRSCIEQRDREIVTARLGMPGIGETWAIRRMLRKETGYRGRDLAQRTREVVVALQEASPEEIEELVEEALNPSEDD